MNRAVFYRGLAFEYKVLSHDSQLALTCDGQLLDVQPDETESVELEKFHENDEPYREIIKRVINKEGNGELKEAIENRE